MINVHINLFFFLNNHNNKIFVNTHIQIHEIQECKPIIIYMYIPTDKID